MKLGFHTDAFNSAYWSFEKCLAWAQQNNLHYIECGLIDGVSWIHGLGYQPHVALYEDPVLLRRKMERYGVQFSQVDAAFPLSGEDGPLRGVPYVMKAIAWAAQIGCPCVDTTDGLHKPEGLSERESMAMMKRSYQQIMQVAQAHEIIVNVEPHGYFTTNPDSNGFDHLNRDLQMIGRINQNLEGKSKAESKYLRGALEIASTEIVHLGSLQKFLSGLEKIKVKTPEVEQIIVLLKANIKKHEIFLRELMNNVDSFDRFDKNLKRSL